MRKAPACIVAIVSVVASGCVMSGKTAKPVTPAPVVAKPVVPPPPAPPPEPLSVPQTQVELPRPQEVDPAAFATDAPVTVELPGPPAAPRPPAVRRPTRTETPPQAVPATPEPAPSPIQEIVSPAEAKRLQDQAIARRRDAQSIVDQLSHRQLTPAEKDVVTRITSLLTSSVDAERKNDMKLADALADRAQILARDLINGK